jgi:hypothetical protein
VESCWNYRKKITGLPEVVYAGQGGLLDVTFDPSFTSNKITGNRQLIDETIAFGVNAPFCVADRPHRDG